MTVPRAMRDRTDGGETLVEVLVAIVILGLAGIAMVTGLQLTVKASDIHRKQTTGGAYAKSIAEAIQNRVAAGNYIQCGSSAPNYVAAVAGAVTLPPGYSASLADRHSVGNTGSPGPCAVAGDDTGLQQLKISVSSADNKVETLYIVVRRACAIDQAACG